MTVVLVATEYGAGPPVAILHGLFGSARNWAGIARRLAQNFRVIVFDLRNHGASPWALTMDYAEMAEDLRAAMRTRGHRHYALIGHSMGGKVAMIAALTGKAEIERLAVVDIAPIAYPLGHLSYVQALRRLDLSAVVRRSAADTALAGAIPDPVERAFLLQSLTLNDGPPRWQLNLAAIEAALPALSGFPAVPLEDVYRGPALFIAGETSDYIRPNDETEIRRLFPHARVLRIAEAGHWVHAEQPEAFINAVVLFLAG